MRFAGSANACECVCVYFSTSALNERLAVGSSALHVIRVYKLCIFATLRASLSQSELVSQRLEWSISGNTAPRRAVCPCYRFDGGDKKCVLNIFLWHKWALAHREWPAAAKSGGARELGINKAVKVSRLCVCTFKTRIFDSSEGVIILPARKKTLVLAVWPEGIFVPADGWEKDTGNATENFLQFVKIKHEFSLFWGIDGNNNLLKFKSTLNRLNFHKNNLVRKFILLVKLTARATGVIICKEIKFRLFLLKVFDKLDWTWNYYYYFWVGSP